MQRINNKIRNDSKFNQWQSTASVVEWFKNLERKSKSKFLKFDVVDFYPSITESLLNNSINFAKTKSDLCENEINIIRHARNSLLFKNNEVWIKKSDNDNNIFDVTMGSFDGAEICELVGLYMLNILVKRFGKKYIGIYRDDGLAVIPYANGPKMERARKDIILIFKDNGLKITSECNLSITDFLDVTFDLDNGTYCPYRKPNSTPVYINKKI